MLSVSIKEIIKSVSFVKSFHQIRCVTVIVLIFVIIRHRELLVALIIHNY